MDLEGQIEDDWKNQPLCKHRESRPWGLQPQAVLLS